jgi:hypothetical protein
MELNKSILKQYEHGDIVLIAKRSGISITTVSNAFKYKECSSKTKVAIMEFYNFKKLAK